MGWLLWDGYSSGRNYDALFDFRCLSCSNENFFFLFLFFGLINQEPYSWLCTCVLHLVCICIWNKRLQSSTGLFCKTEGIGKLSWKIFFPLFPFFLAPSPSSLQEVTLNRELFSRLQLEFYNKISVRSPYFFSCKVVAVII